MMRNAVLMLFAANLAFAFVAAAQPAQPVNPYANVVARNIFGLTSPSAAEPPVVESPALPKITPTGTMTVFGRWQVLFTVTPAAEAGRAAQKESFVLGEGEAENGIGVIEFHPTAGTILFNNHGTFQELPLEIRSK